MIGLKRKLDVGMISFPPFSSVVVPIATEHHENDDYAFIILMTFLYLTPTSALVCLPFLTAKPTQLIRPPLLGGPL